MSGCWGSSLYGGLNPMDTIRLAIFTVSLFMRVSGDTTNRN